MNWTAPACALVMSAALCAPAAEARTIHDERYAFDITWNAAVRMLRVDLGFSITERDRDTGFVLFVFNDNGHTSPGSFEIVRADVEGVAGTRVIVQLTQLPLYMEHFLITRLTRKLHDEFGEPPPVPHAPPPHQEHPSDDPAAPPPPSTPDGGAPVVTPPAAP